MHRAASMALVALVTLLFGSAHPTPLRGQDPVVPHGRVLWQDVGVAFGAALLVDEPLRAFAAAHQQRAIDQLAGAVDPLGRAQYLVPALVAGAVLPYALGDHPLAMRAVRVGLGYAASDLLGGVVRVVVSRHRPDSTGDPWRFRPFRPQGDWGSMPSAHVTHAFAIASGVAEVSGRPWVAGVAYGLASLVAMQRVYRQAHWSSDVVAAAGLSIVTSRAVIDLHF
jgi:membrane-associated phospholipid phosphatase